MHCALEFEAQQRTSVSISSMTNWVVGSWWFVSGIFGVEGWYLDFRLNLDGSAIGVLSWGLTGSNSITECIGFSSSGLKWVDM